MIDRVAHWMEGSNGQHLLAVFIIALVAYTIWAMIDNAKAKKREPHRFMRRCYGCGKLKNEYSFRYDDWDYCGMCEAHDDAAS